MLFDASKWTINGAGPWATSDVATTIGGEGAGATVAVVGDTSKVVMKIAGLASALEDAGVAVTVFDDAADLRGTRIIVPVFDDESDSSVPDAAVDTLEGTLAAVSVLVVLPLLPPPEQAERAAVTNKTKNGYFKMGNPLDDGSDRSSQSSGTQGLTRTRTEAPPATPLS